MTKMIDHYAILKRYNDKNGCIDICFYDCTEVNDFQLQMTSFT